MLHQRRHAWQRNTFRCTCCCCSQITKYPTQHVPLGCAQGFQLTHARWPDGRARRSGTRRAATLAMLHQRRHAWQRNTFRCTCCCCSQITKYPTQHVPLGCAQGTQLTRALEETMVGRAIAVRVVQPTLAMLHQRRHAWQRNTFRCTCCCCSQITKYPTQHVPLGCTQGFPANARAGPMVGRDMAVRVVQPPWPCCTSDDMPGNETPFAARVAVVLKLPSTQHNTYRWGAPREPS